MDTTLSVNEYLANLSGNELQVYEHIKSLVTKTIPEAEETMSYAMPTFKYGGKAVLHFGAFKNHLSLFPASSQVLSQMSDELADFKTAKGTLQFTLDKQIPDATIERMLQVRLNELHEQYGITPPK